uniref:DC2-related axonemal dynein intermediate chain 5 n=1 Tax=Ciona intestinalis TaxID=7719 RepID=Q2PEE5_CIOIN|nr:DC2-related axonemal dynein intermediate chain 5 [Ciona intestinalis]BAE71136.1 DC2-related axonemal dynein intermediate chain 5 [Ciona intestinalis]|eukprot:NP_001071888.1 DC2-related axonemal dynein intermediate chain 5 [Ciona intestinalis]
MFTGKSAKSFRSDGSDGDIDAYESELEKLRRKYRIMEGDRQAYALESQDLIRRQLIEIENLRSERMELVKNLNLAESKLNQEKDKVNMFDLQKLLSEKDDCLLEIEEEKVNQSKLNEEIQEWEKNVQEQRKKMGGADSTRSFAQTTQKRMSVLEGRLHRALSKFNIALTCNGALREQIETLRIEKGRFQIQFKKLDKSLKDLKREIGQVIEASTLAYDQRDDAHSKIFLLKEKAEKDLQLFNAEIKELQRVINHDKKVRDFMMAKATARGFDIISPRKEKDVKKEEGRMIIQSYEEAFAEIEQITGEVDVNEIVANFIKVEDCNFALFNYVNEQNNEVERLRDIIEAIHKDISQFHDQGLKLDSGRQEILRKLEAATSYANAKYLENIEQLSTTLKILDRLKLGIGSIFKRTGCDLRVLNDLLGSSEGVKDDNIMQYLGIIEQRANELLTAQSFIDSQDYEKQYDPQESARVILGQVPVETVQPLLIAPPSTGDDYDSDDLDIRGDEESRPLSQNELKQTIMKAVLKKEAAATKKGFRYDLSAAKKKK